MKQSIPNQYPCTIHVILHLLSLHLYHVFIWHFLRVRKFSKSYLMVVLENPVCGSCENFVFIGGALRPVSWSDPLDLAELHNFRLVYDV